jgi:hypothetical protein
MASIYISDLIVLPAITNDDFIPLVQSSSLTTYRVDFNTINAWMSSSVTASQAIHAQTASFVTTASYANTASLANTASFLLYQGIPNGTASYAFSASHADTASYFNTGSGFVAAFATYAISASWASSSVSSSYVTASGVDGTVASASYALSASYVISSSYGMSASYAKTASYAWTSSHAFYAENTVYNLMSLYGPFTSSAEGTSETVGWSRWDYEKQAVAFTLAGTSDVILDCTVNYTMDELSGKCYYIGAVVRQDGLVDPTINPPTTVSPAANNETNATYGFDDFKFISVYDFSENARVDSTSKLVIRKNGLTSGKWIVYFAVYRTNLAVSPWGTTGVGQKATLEDFLDDVPTRESSQARFYKFGNSVTVNVYATTTVTQATL